MIIMNMDIILIFFFAVISIGLVKGSCPSTCSCYNGSSGSRVLCDSKYLGSIPALPNDTYHLDLQFNNITAIDIQFCKEMPQLQNLYISNNLITEIPENTFVHCEQLYRIYLYNNEISVIEPFTFVDLPNLYYLHLQNNKIRSLEINTFVNMTNLYYLHLHQNEISTIEPLTFVDLPSLLYLELSHNGISTIKPFTFMGLPSLQYLYLNDNNISDIEEHAFGKLTSLTLLELSGNPLYCDCSIFAFWSWLIERSSIYNIGSSATCSNGTLVKSLQPAVLDRCHPDNCQCFNGGKCVAMGYQLICDCLGQWTGTFCQDSQCTSYDCGFGDCYIEPVNGTAQCSCADRYVNYCPVFRKDARIDYRQEWMVEKHNLAASYTEKNQRT